MSSHGRAVERALSLALFGLALFPTESPGEDAPCTVVLAIEDGVPAVRSAPRSLDMVTGWKYPCTLEVVNEDETEIQVTFRVEGRTRLIANQTGLAIQANEKLAIPVLLQTLSPDAHRFELVVTCGQREARAPIDVVTRLERDRVAFGMVEHFEYQGSIDSARRAGPPPKGPKKPPQKDPKEKDVSHLTVAPDREAGERVLADMRVLQDAGCQVFRADLSWRIIEYEEGTFRWDRADWIVRSLRSPEGGGCRLVAQIGYQPTWLPVDFPRTEAGLKAWSRWVEAVVTRYAKDVDAWEIWNEPEVFWFRPGKDIARAGKSTPEEKKLIEDYAEMILTVVRTATGIIRKADPDAMILSPGFVDPLPGSDAFVNALHREVLDRGILEQVDAFCYHNYPLGFPSGKVPLSDPEAWRAFDRSADSRDLIDLLESHGGKPLYCTEFGGYRLPAATEGPEETPAALATLRNGCILAHQGYRGIAYFELFDWGGATTYLVRHADAHRTRGFEAFRRLSEALTGSVPRESPRIPLSRIRDCDYDGLVVKAFSRGSEDILCIWNNDTRRHTLGLRPQAPPQRANEVCFWEHARFALKGEFVTEEKLVIEDRSAEDLEVAVEPFEFHIFSRLGPRPEFGWLESSTVR